ncbi:hypothetical protein GF323_00740 [Candidatus Woesearchaeota archaeon]|nr:hypothetical protein [Candidatus Woesearchaeota archaeon]
MINEGSQGKKKRDKLSFHLYTINRVQERLVKTVVEIAHEYRNLHQGYSIQSLKERLEQPEPRLEESHVKSPFDDLLAKIALEKFQQNLGKCIGYEGGDIEIPLGWRVENALVDNRVTLPNIEAIVTGRPKDQIPQGLVETNRPGEKYEVATGIHIGPVDGNKNLRDKIKEMIRDIEELGAENIDPNNYLTQATINAAWIDFLHPAMPFTTVTYDLSRPDGGIISAREVEGEYETFRGIGLQRLSRDKTLQRFDLIAEPTIFIADFQHHYRDMFAIIEKYVRAYASKKGITIDPERGPPSSSYFLRQLLTGVKYILYYDARSQLDISTSNPPRIYDDLLKELDEPALQSGKSEYRFALLKLSNINSIVPGLLGAGLSVTSATGQPWGEFGEAYENTDFRDPSCNLNITIAAGHPKYFGKDSTYQFNILHATNPALEQSREELSNLLGRPQDFSSIAKPTES